MVVLFFLVVKTARGKGTHLDTVKSLIALLAILFCANAYSAQLVGNEITLCTNGYSPDNTTCTTYDTGDCDSGYYDLSPDATSFISPSGDSCTYASYAARTLPDTTITLVYHGAVVGNEITLCANGYSPDNTSCSTYSRGDCASDYHEIETNATSFISPSNNLCTYSGYKSRTMPETTITLEYHGAVVGNEITLCANGYSPDGSTCTTYTQTGNCPNNYYNVNTGDAAFTAKNGSCASGYHQYDADESCGYAPTSSTCVNLCSSGQLSTSAGTCASLCSLGVTTLRTGNGVVVPLWSTKQTTPALNIAVGNGTCYGNLTTETADGPGIYLNYNNATYRTTK